MGFDFVDNLFNEYQQKLDDRFHDAEKWVEKSIKSIFKKKPRRGRGRDFSYLLDNIEETFDYFELRHLPSDIESCQRIGFKRIGVFVPDKFDMADICPSDWPTGIPNPKTATFAVALTDYTLATAAEALEEPDDRFVIRMLLVNRLKKPPPLVKAPKGCDIYGCYLGLQHGKKTYWLRFYASYERIIGKVVICPEVMFKPVDLKSGGYDIRYTQKVLGVYAADGQADWGKNKTQQRQVLASWLGKAFTAWHQRKDMWKVAVRKGDHRVTFVIPRSEASDYFKDRDKTALTAAGKRRPIIHIARQHVRKVGEKEITIREHIRGLRDFDWLGYRFFITAPDFHIYDMDSCEVLSEELPPDVRPSREYIGLNIIARELANAEDFEQKRMAA